MKLPWREHKVDEKGKMNVILPEDLVRCISRILEEKKNQCNFNNVPFEGMTLEEIAVEVQRRLGNEWTVAELKKFGLKL